MGQDISVSLVATSATKKISCNVDSRAVIDSGNKYRNTLIEGVCEISKMFSDTFLVEAGSSMDFEAEYQEWYIIEKGRMKKASKFTRFEGDSEWEWDLNPTIPEWYTPEEPEGPEMYLHLISGRNTNQIAVTGFTLEEIQKVAIIFAQAFLLYSSNEYVRFSPTHVIHDGSIVAISTFSEAIRKEVFGVAR